MAKWLKICGFPMLMSFAGCLNEITKFEHFDLTINMIYIS